MLWSCTVTAVFFEINNLEPPVYSEPDKCSSRLGSYLNECDYNRCPKKLKKVIPLFDTY